MRRLILMQCAALVLGLAPAAAQSRGLAGYPNCGVKLGTTAAQLKAAEPNAIWDRRDDPALKQAVPVAILGRDRGDRPTDEKRMMRIYFAGRADAGVAYRVSCQRKLVDGEIEQGIGEIRAIAAKFGPPAEAFNGDRPIPFAVPDRAGVAAPIEYYWGGTRTEFRANAKKPMLLVQIWKDGMDRDVFDIQFHLVDDRLRR